jgi:RecA-family ATPase
MASLLEHAEQEGGVPFVLIDTFNRTLMGDENAPGYLTTFLAGYSEIINQLGYAVLLLHHPS